MAIVNCKVFKALPEIKGCKAGKAVEDLRVYRELLMPNQFASGKWAIAQCDRCNFRFKLKQLKSLVIKTKNVNILVCTLS